MRLSYTPPPGWDFVTLSDLAKPEKGSIRIGPFGSALKKHEYSENGIRVLGIEDVHPNQFLSDRCKYIPDAKFCELRQYEVSDGDVLVTNMGTVGRACAVPAGTERSIISSHLIKVALNRSRTDPNYLCWMLNYSPLVVAQIRAKSHGAIMAGFNSSLLKSLQIPLPPPAEQKRIAGILDAMDALRAKRREALAQLDALLQSTFLDMFGDPATNPIGLRKETLKSVFQFTTGKLDSNAAVEGGKYPFFTCARETSAIDDYAFDCEALLLAGNNANADYSVKHYKGRFNAYQRTYVITIKENALIYAYARLVLEYLLGDLKRYSKGTNTKYLTLVILNRMPILVPPLDLQRRFAAIVESVEQQKANQRAHLAELDTLFASLQSRAFRGVL